MQKNLQNVIRYITFVGSLAIGYLTWWAALPYLRFFYFNARSDIFENGAGAFAHHPHNVRKSANNLQIFFLESRYTFFLHTKNNHDPFHLIQ